MLLSTFLLVAISRYDTVKREQPFHDWWSKRCEEDWLKVLNYFMYGVIIFIVVLGLAGWTIYPHGRFENEEACTAGRKVPSCYFWITNSIMSAIAIAVIFQFTQTFMKWYSWLTVSRPPLHTALSVPLGNSRPQSWSNVSILWIPFLDSFYHWTRSIFFVTNSWEHTLYVLTSMD